MRGYLKDPSVAGPKRGSPARLQSWQCKGKLPTVVCCASFCWASGPLYGQVDRAFVKTVSRLAVMIGRGGEVTSTGHAQLGCWSSAYQASWWCRSQNAECGRVRVPLVECFCRTHSGACGMLAMCRGCRTMQQAETAASARCGAVPEQWLAWLASRC